MRKDKYEFKKSESGMFQVEYKRLAKGSKIDNYYREKNPKGKGYFVDANSEIHRANRRYENKKTKEKGVNQSYDHPEWSQNKKKPSAKEHGVSEGGARSRAAVRSKKAGDSEAADIHNKKAKEEHAKTLVEMKVAKKPNLPKSEVTYKSESGMHTVEYKRLAKGRMATPEEKRQLGYDKQTAAWRKRQEEIKGTKLDTEHPQHGDEKTRVKNIPSQKPEKMAASEGGDLTDVKHAKEGQKKISYGERAAVSVNPKDASGKQQKTAAHKVRDEKAQARKEHAETGKINPKFGQTESTNVARNRRAEDKGIEGRKKVAGKKGQQRRVEVRQRATDMKASEMEKCGEMTKKEVNKIDNKVQKTKGIDFDKENVSDKGKEEKKGIKRPLEKCGEMTSGKKLKKFMGKLKQPSPGMVQEPQK